MEDPNVLGTSGVRQLLFMTVFTIQVKRGVDIVRYSIFQNAKRTRQRSILVLRLRIVHSMDMGFGLLMVHLEKIEIPSS